MKTNSLLIFISATLDGQIDATFFDNQQISFFKKICKVPKCRNYLTVKSRHVLGREAELWDLKEE